MRRMIPFFAFLVFAATISADIIPAKAVVQAIVRPAIAVSSVAVRLQSRIVREQHVRIPVDDIARALTMRDDLLRSAIVVSFDVANRGHAAPESWTLALADHPDWITVRVTDTSVRYVLDERVIARDIVAALPASFPLARDATALIDPADAAKLSISGSPSPGFQIDAASAAHAIVTAINARRPIVSIGVSYDPGRLFAQTESGIIALTELSSGQSDFSGSPPGRIENVIHALQYLNGSVTTAGNIFSFNSLLAGSSGWQNSLVIMNGKDLVEAPGGGICQASTTVYRAAVNAGLPVPVRANHSLYVSYYRDGGVGIDATVMAPMQDLKIENDTQGPIVILARAAGTGAFVDFYGIPDGRSVTLLGPYFAKTSPDTLFNGSSLQVNEIGWKQSVRYTDGRVRNVDIVSRYDALPRTLASEYPVPAGASQPTVSGDSGTDIASH